MTDCGNTNAKIPLEINRNDWKYFSCKNSNGYFNSLSTAQNYINSNGGNIDVCFKREQYSDIVGNGCPAQSMCCATLSLPPTKQIETKYTTNTVQTEKSEPTNVDYAGELFVGVLVGLFVACFFYIIPTVRNWSFFERSNRTEYWSYRLIMSIGIVPIIALLKLQPESVFIWGVWVGFTMLTFIPNTALLVRRLHDINMSGWCSLLCFVPCGGDIISLIIGLTKGSKHSNQYGKPSKKTWFGLTKRSST